MVGRQVNPIMSVIIDNNNNNINNDVFTPNRPFPSSPKSLLQSESKCEIFVMVIRFNFNMNEN